jgi:prepilin-type N-terminal cleavage/methylation domain-containing protein/prepilin-type processing-associated H-X9-DG protein
MKTPLSKIKVRGLTLFEVLVVIAALAVLAAILLPALAPRPYHHGAYCENDLKQVGLAFRVWEGDNNDKYPMSFSVTNGGTMELVESGVVFRHFEVMSNELNTPKILFCPQETDPKRSMASMWRSTPASHDEIPFTGDTNTSYFIGVDATDLNPSMFLAGDRNLAWKGTALKPGLHSLSTNDVVSWTAELHVNQGNVLMADGSVQSFNQKSLQEAMINTGFATNRLAVP